MKAWSRQPFVGLALAAGTGVLIADYAPNPSSALAVGLALLGLLALVSRRSPAVYAFVAAGFFFLHSERIVNSPGRAWRVN